MNDADQAQEVAQSARRFEQLRRRLEAAAGDLSAWEVGSAVFGQFDLLARKRSPEIALNVLGRMIAAGGGPDADPNAQRLIAWARVVRAAGLARVERLEEAAHETEQLEAMGAPALSVLDSMAAHYESETHDKPTARAALAATLSSRVCVLSNMPRRDDAQVVRSIEDFLERFRDDDHPEVQKMVRAWTQTLQTYRQTCDGPR